MRRKLINRLKEPSTYAGLSGAAIALGFTAGEFQDWVNVIAGFFGFLAIIVKEVGSEE